MAKMMMTVAVTRDYHRDNGANRIYDATRVVKQSILSEGGSQADLQAGWQPWGKPGGIRARTDLCSFRRRGADVSTPRRSQR